MAPWKQEVDLEVSESLSVQRVLTGQPARDLPPSEPQASLPMAALALPPISGQSAVDLGHTLCSAEPPLITFPQEGLVSLLRKWLHPKV